MGESTGGSSFGLFLGGFRWFLLVEGDFEWFQVVYCFSSYINFTAYRTLNSLLYSWAHVIDCGHSIFLFKVKQQEKIIVAWSPSRLKISDYFLYSIVLCQIKSFFQTKFIEKAVTKYKASRSIAKYLRRGVLARSV